MNRWATDMTQWAADMNHWAGNMNYDATTSALVTNNTAHHYNVASYEMATHTNHHASTITPPTYSPPTIAHPTPSIDMFRDVQLMRSTEAMCVKDYKLIRTQNGLAETYTHQHTLIRPTSERLHAPQYGSGKHVRFTDTKDPSLEASNWSGGYIEEL